MQFRILENNQVGIYAIINHAQGRVYIGLANTGFAARWRSHRMLLSKGEHHNRPLQQDWTAYGAADFDFVIVDAAPRLRGGRTDYDEWMRYLEWFRASRCAWPVYNTGRLAPRPLPRHDNPYAFLGPADLFPDATP